MARTNMMTRMAAGMAKAVVVAAAAVAMAVIPASADIFYFKDSAADGVWNWNGWSGLESCTGDGGEFMNALVPMGAACANVVIPPESLLVHTDLNLVSTYAAGTWHARLYLAGSLIPARTRVRVRLYEEAPGPNPLCTARIYLGAGVAAVGGTYANRLVDIPIVLGGLGFGPAPGHRLLAVIWKTGSGAVSLNWNGANCPSHIESPPLFFTGGKEGGESSPVPLEQSTWGSIKRAYGAGD